MARKKPSSPGDPQPPGMTNAAGMLATFAAGVLTQPESRSHAADLKLGRSERAVIAGVPGLDVGLKERIDIPSTGVKSFRFTLDELARICLGLSEALLDAEGREVVKLLKVTGKVTDVLDQAVGELAKGGSPRRAAQKAGKTTPKSQATKAARATGTIYQLKITLKDIRPSIWRRLLVRDCSLAALHEVIQVAMGWENYWSSAIELPGIVGAV
ncbi:IS1096 element passenger TnpR family protein [Tautonia plasticadhaerens]|uniref:Plasmid pRiA4b ORF-3-like protein n=1 Tax=Tautonia plasticadhaerens TaxID=2527974 RepID=A0A518HA09_9BACT|nr:hypothetical protein [Tautonia plasticadhaerens]QDV37688.1 Plasmid pRiA4b ORF-3-like protein [Tautonia plasticadhaerens]